MPPPKGSWNPLAGPGDYTTTALVHNSSYPAIDPAQTADLSGKSVFVTGASKGLGRHIALSFAQAGASPIALGARSDLSSTAEEVRAAAKRAGRSEPRVVALRLDVSERESVEQAVAELGRELGGRVDVVVNNAGVLAGEGKVGEADAEGWWENFTANLRGPFLVLSATIPLLLRSELKTAITVSSVGAHCVMPGVSAYQTSKLSVTRLTEFVAAEYADQGLIAFSVHPGNILTDIVKNGEGMDENFKAIFTETPELCGDSLVFLTKERREWLSGRYVNCTWDLPELVSEAKREEIVKNDLFKVRLAV